MAGGNKAVAVRSGVPLSTLDSYVRAISGMKLDAVISLAEATNINIEWLATGRGPMRPGDLEPSPLVPAATANQDHIPIPRLDVRAGAGRGVLANDETVKERQLLSASYVREFLHRRPENLVLIEAYGSSMAPTIMDGDQVLIDTSVREIRSGGIYVIRVENEIMVKRLIRTVTGEIRVISDNPAYAEERITPSEATPLHIVGEVVYRAGPVSSLVAPRPL